ncbi:MAG: polysaccharide deacetylase family protein [Vicinamibacterales bacterium]
MRWPRGTKLRRIARCAAQRIVPGSLILLYHRVAENAADPWSLCVTPRHFAEHLEVLRGRVVRLTELRGESGGGRAIGRLAITFDDGYADTLLVARPLLERHETPATVFVSTGGVNDGKPFWWDELTALLATPRDLPASLDLCVRGKRQRFESGPRVEPCTESDAWAPHRIRLHHQLHSLLGALDAASRREQLATLREWVGGTESPPTARVLTRSEIARLGGDGLVEIGAHTVSHPTLPSLEPDEQEREIRDSQSLLAAVAGRPITSFAYPHGRHDVTTRRVVRRAGFERACTSRFGTVGPYTDALRLPRLEVPDCDGEVFNKILRRLAF